MLISNRLGWSFFKNSNHRVTPQANFGHDNSHPRIDLEIIQCTLVILGILFLLNEKPNLLCIYFALNFIMNRDHDLVKTSCILYKNDQLYFEKVSQEGINDGERYFHLLTDLMLKG